MFVVHDVLVSDDVLAAPFTCHLAACRGACCVQGESGAPLEPEERTALEEVLPTIRNDLRPEAIEVIDRKGVWEETGAEQYATTCVDDAECVFVTYEGPVAKCAVQKAHQEGRIDFPKPISCHLFPLRAEQHGAYEVLNYEQAEVCEPGRRCGRRRGTALADFLEEPLTRRYGTDWYAQFRETVAKRRSVLFDEDE